MNLKRVVVTGLGAVTPIGNTVPSLWDSVVNGKSGAGPITLFDCSKFKTKFACEVKNFDPAQFMDPKLARKMDRFSHFAVVSASEAIRDSGIEINHSNAERVGTIFGVGIGGLGSMEEEFAYYTTHKDSEDPRFGPFYILRMISDTSVGHISIMYGLKGPNYVTTSACASSSHAIIDAMNTIRLGKADVMITGGAEAAVTISGIGGFGSMKAISSRNDDPQGASRPFSKSRDGFVLGEGGAALVLEEYEHAVARGAHIYAELVGEGCCADAHHITAPNHEGAIRVMRLALEDAGLKPEDVDYINVHGTSTPLGDISEVKAIKEVFGDHAYNLNISSTKSMTGHLLGASGAVEAVLSVLSIEHGMVPPTINHAEGDDDEEIDSKLNFTFNKPQQRDIRVALSNTFGFGGHNATVIFKKI